MCDLCALGLPLVPVESPCAPAARGCPQPVLSCCRVRFCGTLCSSSRCVTRSLSPHLWISLLCRACPVHLCEHLFSSARGAVETQHFGFHRLCRVWSELFEVRGVQDHPWCPPGWGVCWGLQQGCPPVLPELSQPSPGLWSCLGSGAGFVREPQVRGPPKAALWGFCGGKLLQLCCTTAELCPTRDVSPALCSSVSRAVPVGLGSAPSVRGPFQQDGLFIYY